MYKSNKKNRHSRKLRGGAGKVNTKKAGNKQKNSKAEPTEQDLMRTLQDSFTTSWVIGDDTIKMGPKKMKERVREQYFQALEEQNKKAEEKVSSVKGIQVKQASQNTLGKAIASGFRQGESAYSQYQRGIQRVGQGARSFGLDVKTDSRALGSQIGSTFGPSKRGTSAGRRAFNNARSRARDRSSGLGTRSSTVRPTGAPPLPGAVGATSFSPIPALPSDAAFTKSGEQVDGITPSNVNTTNANTGKNKNNNKNRSKVEYTTKNCPCCQRELADGAEPITIDSVKNVWSDLKVELAGEKAKRNEARVKKVLGGKEEINEQVEKLKEAKEAMEKAMKEKRKEVLRGLGIDGNLDNEQIDKKIKELEEKSDAVQTEAETLNSKLSREREEARKKECIEGEIKSLNDKKNKKRKKKLEKKLEKMNPEKKK